MSRNRAKGTAWVAPLPCACSHGHACHDLNKRGERTACSVSTGPTGTTCTCTRYSPEGDQ